MREKMSKRRRTSSIASRGHEDDSLDGIDTTPVVTVTRKRTRKQQDPMELVQQVYDSIRNFKKEDGTLLCDAFIRVPKRRQEPGYYEVVTNPIDLLKVQQKLKTDEYEDIEDLQADIELIANNAKAFYKKNSTEYRDACDLIDLFLANKARIYDKTDDDDKKLSSLRVGRLRRSARDDAASEVSSESSTNLDEEYSVYEDLFTAVMTATDADNNPLHGAFQLLPSKRKYPEYYEVIEIPVDLKTIAAKVQSNEYAHLHEMEKDLLQMTKNACAFNEPGSKIYRDAKALKKVIMSKKIEIDHSAKTQTGGKCSERIRNKRLKGTSCLSAVTAALSYDSSSDDEPDPEESVDEDVDFDAESPMWQLFDAVRNVTNLTGTAALCEPFWRLPSRRTYPDYYKEIKNPVSMTQIRRKLNNHAYGTVSEVAGDLTVMFENAKRYNVATSKLYRDAVKLQKVMQTKVQELLEIDQVTNTKVTNRTRKDNDLNQESRRKSLLPKPRMHFPMRGRPPKDPIPLKKRLHAMSKYLLDYIEDGRKPMLAFMEKPSKKLYPDYYDVISEPIDFIEIEAKIRGEQYAAEAELIRDFKLMFDNCKQYNEENSPIYEDAAMLSALMMDKFGHVLTPERRTYSRIYKPRKAQTPSHKHCKTLYDTIKDYREPKAQRQLASIFMRLPSKNDYPDYYDIIKQPIDMDKIGHKLRSREYEAVDELAADFNLMFDNACKYNEPDSQIYKDALVLQRLCNATKLQLKEDDDTIPDVSAAIQDLLLSLFTSVYNHQDVEEHCYSDSMADLPEHDDIDGKKVRALSLDLIKRRLDKGLYKRLDTFQEDFFACLERARLISRTDSLVFEDSIEMQRYFIQLRDELCRNGELLHSPALQYTIGDLLTSAETLRQSKAVQESLDDENETRSSSDDSIIKEAALNPGESMTCNQLTFKVGDFVYMDAKDKGVEPHILLIERLWTNQQGQQMLYGNHYLRPAETYHLSTKKFLEREVFKSDTHVAVPLEEVKERCCILNLKQYLTHQPEGFDEKDVYVCECRYSTRLRSFKRLKTFSVGANIVLLPREKPLEPKRVISVFRERVEKHKDELAELQEIERLVEKEKPNIMAFNVEIDDGNTYYEQYNTICAGTVKTGDFVYVAADGGRQTVAQIDAIWDTKDGKSYFRGPWFITPSEVPTTQLRGITYKQELFLSTLEDTNPIVSIVGKCAVLDYNDYVSSRQTEIPESDVFICQSLYDEINRQVQKLGVDGVKKYTHTPGVTEDEIYYFPKLINPLRMGADNPKSHSSLMEVESSPMLTKLNDMDILMEDSIDGPPSVGSGDHPVIISTPSGSSISTPATAKKQKIKYKLVSGYILYSRAHRKSVVANNPDSNFGDISRIVGNEWRSLTAAEKAPWEEKATKVNEEIKMRGDVVMTPSNNEETCTSPAPPIHPDLIYECYWDQCDYQFEELSDCMEHCIKEKDGVAGHVQSYFQQNPDAEMHCLWRGCQRIKNKKNSQPFPNVQRLVRHVKDLHINKGNGRIVASENRNKNFKPSSRGNANANRPTPTATPTPSSASKTFMGNNAAAASTSAQVPVVPPVPPKQLEPLFISVPPRPQRALHSEAYIKYIEGLHAENKYISNWERTLNGTQETVAAPDPEKLSSVATWLGNRANQQDNVLNALWTLRNQLLRDTLGLQKTL